MQFDIHHDPAQGRFETQVDGVTGHIDYSRNGQVISIDHTIVPSEIGGRGIAAQLVKAVLDHAREQGLKVIPACSYADVWMQRHPEYDDLRVGG